MKIQALILKITKNYVTSIFFEKTFIRSSHLLKREALGNKKEDTARPLGQSRSQPCPRPGYFLLWSLDCMLMETCMLLAAVKEGQTLLTLHWKAKKYRQT